NPSRLILGEQLGCGASARFISCQQHNESLWLLRKWREQRLNIPITQFLFTPHYSRRWPCLPAGTDAVCLFFRFWRSTRRRDHKQRRALNSSGSFAIFAATRRASFAQANAPMRVVVGRCSIRLLLETLSGPV